jgi:hypothetical protein
VIALNYEDDLKIIYVVMDRVLLFKHIILKCSSATHVYGIPIILVYVINIKWVGRVQIGEITNWLTQVWEKEASSSNTQLVKPPSEWRNAPFPIDC